MKNPKSLFLVFADGDGDTCQGRVDEDDVQRVPVGNYGLHRLSLTVRGGKVVATCNGVSAELAPGERGVLVVEGWRYPLYAFATHEEAFRHARRLAPCGRLAA